MEFPTNLTAIEGARALFDWFGYWPSFHDAEILSLHLNRVGESVLTLHTWETTGQIDDQGYFVMSKHVVVEFLIKEVLDLNLIEFSRQNVIFDLDVEKTEKGYRFNLGGSYGLHGAIDATDFSIRITQGMPRPASQLSA